MQSRRPMAAAETANANELVNHSAAARGHYEQGCRYEFGVGVRVDFLQAVKSYRRAAMHGYPQAQNALGFLYAMGRGVTQNNDMAASWFRAAAEQGHIGAQTNLGVMYAEGRGVEKSETDALHWFCKAAAAGSYEAQKLLTKLKLGLWPDNANIDDL
jgi:uncharacterized protein